MTCYRPVKMWIVGRTDTGKPLYRPYQTKDTRSLKPIKVPCGKCIGCLLDRTKDWAMRCVHELMYHNKACFLTLTYDKDHIDDNYSLRKSDFTCFMKRLRKAYPEVKIKYLQCGEYGTLKHRPHHHCILYGLDFSEDRKIYKRSGSGNILYTSEKLNKIWQNGFCVIGNVSVESVQYVCRYTLKKQYGTSALNHYGKRVPEYITCSKRPSIGKKFFDDYHEQMYSHNYIHFNGKKCRIPRYYDRCMQQLDEDLFRSVVKIRRKASLILENHPDYTREALKRREQAILSRIKKLVREFEQNE